MPIPSNVDSEAMKHYVMIQRPELPADMHAAMSRLNERTGEQLIAAYNAQCELGFTGVYAQAIHVLALHQHLKAKYGKGPLRIEDNAVLTMSGPVHWDGKSWASNSPVPSEPNSEACSASDCVKDGASSKVSSRASDRWSRMVKWFRQRLNYFRAVNEDSIKTPGTSKSEDDRAEFMKRKYAELMMSHNAWTEELEGDDF